MKENSNKVLSFPARVPAKADYQRVKSNYSLREIKELFGLSERTIRRWTEQGIIQGTPALNNDFTYDFQALTQFRRVRDLRAQGHSIRQIEAELQGQLNLFRRVEENRIARLRTPFEEALVLDDQNDPRAIESYLEAIDNGDNVAEAYCNLGIINKDLGNVGVALDNFTLALKHEPRHVEAHYNLGNLYFDAGQLPLARLHYEAAAQIEPRFSLVYFNLALAHFKLNDLTAALAAIASYKELRQPDDEETEAINQLLRAMQDPRRPEL
uniref:Putative O-linked GlcNAc transferase n=1 Tax=uncultured Acidobacteriota bacterium TaxID=171953 RepID=Q7X2V9_9BACT|nr:putative O-linked GlcNAc transferase [uncultured Acidobacteriota bacterium]